MKHKYAEAAAWTLFFICCLVALIWAFKQLTFVRGATPSIEAIHEAQRHDTNL
jgi:hypothetical protein